jgi:tetratricopeptide (TPR) repeat protein
MGQVEKANAALLAASRGAEPYVAEQARELLPARYPYVYEFQTALALDRDNVPLRRELAYLHLAMGNKAGAETEFRAVVTADPEDYLSAAQLGFLLIVRSEPTEARLLLERALASDDPELTDRVRAALHLPKTLRRRPDESRSETSNEAKMLAQKSLDAGYLKDALKYLTVAHENDPVDFGVMLRLGWTYNILHDDKSAVEWFRLARVSPDPKVQNEAARAYSNLKPALARFRTTTWLYPFYSTRWRDLFMYSQVRTELRLPNLPLRLYLSTRLNGDIRQTGTPLSERSAIFGGGVSARLGKNATLWAEAGVSVGYKTEPERPRVRSDYRGGLAWTKSFGRNIGSPKGGPFFETGADAVYISRFEHDGLLYGQTKTGWTLGRADSLQLQVYWNANGTADTRRFSWANTVETGPGVRWKLPWLNPPVLFSLDALSGRYLVPDGIRAANYRDFRAGFWYAFSR